MGSAFGAAFHLAAVSSYDLQCRFGINNSTVSLNVQEVRILHMHESSLRWQVTACRKLLLCRQRHVLLSLLVSCLTIIDWRIEKDQTVDGKLLESN